MLGSVARITVVATLALATGGCSFPTDFAGTRFRCDQGVCPAGYSCVAGVCEADPDGSGDAGPDTATSCGTFDLLYDDFEGPEFDEERWYDWTDGPVDIVQEDGVLAFEMPANTWDIGAAIGNDTALLFENTRVFVEVPEVDPEADLYASIELWVTDDIRAYIVEHQGAMRFQYRIGDDEYEPVTLPYDPVAHRWWQLREQDGTMYHETSPDGVVWTTHVETPSAPFARVSWVELGAWISSPELDPRYVVFDNVNGGVDGQAVWCAIGDLSDDFEDGELDQEWDDWDDGAATLAERDGELTFDYDGSGGGSAGYESLRRFDVSRGSAAVEVLRPTDAVDLAFGVWVDDDNHFNFYQDGEELVCTKRIAGISSTPAVVGFDPEAHRWWRFHGEDEALHFQVSPDGVEWTTIVSHTEPTVPLDAMVIHLWSEGAPSEPLSSVHGFDNFNLVPR